MRPIGEGKSDPKKENDQAQPIRVGGCVVLGTLQVVEQIVRLHGQIPLGADDLITEEVPEIGLVSVSIRGISKKEQIEIHDTLLDVIPAGIRIVVRRLPPQIRGGGHSRGSVTLLRRSPKWQ